MDRPTKGTRQVFAVISLAAGLTLQCANALAEIKVDLYLAPAPNLDGSPNYGDWFQNAQAFALGAAAPVGSGHAMFLGDVNGTLRPFWEFEVTSFPAWEGSTDPYFAGAELGQRMHAVYHIYGTAGEKVELRWIRGLHVTLTWNGAVPPDACDDLEPEIGPIDFDDTREFDAAGRVGYDNADLATPITYGNGPVDHIIGTLGIAFWPQGRRPAGSPDGCENPDLDRAMADYATGAGQLSDFGAGTAGLSASLSYDDGVNPPASASASVRSTNTRVALRVDDTVGPAEPIGIHIEVTTNMAQVASVGARITYDAGALETAASDISIAKGAGIPESWTFVFLDTSTPGRIDAVLSDPSTGVLIEPAGVPATFEALRAGFRRRTPGCDPLSLGFEATPPDAGSPAESAFPQANQFIVYRDASNGDLLTDAAGPMFLTPAIGPAGFHNHAFIRGNVNARASHGINIADAVDLAGLLFAGYRPAFNCPAAFDANNDGSLNIIDLVTVVQAFFHPELVTIPPPNAAIPGPGIPGAGAPDGGEIPSALGCPDGEPFCP